MTTQTFHELSLVEPIMRAITAMKYERPTPIQAAAIPHLLAGHDLIGCAQTGTGKTAAFALPILQRLCTEYKKMASRHVRVLVLTPTRELAAQVSKSFRDYGCNIDLSNATVFGGVRQHPQVKALLRGVDVLVATPGRLLDLMNQGYIKLSEVEIFVLDEADRMLDMGFMPDIKKIIAALPKKRQSLLFSATMAPEIVRLAGGLLNNPIEVSVATPTSTVDTVTERVFFVDDDNKRALLSDLLKKSEVGRTLVFTRTKRGADRLVKHLDRASIKSNAIHGDKSQAARTAALRDFRFGRCNILVATDIASRGIDVTGITHVINYDLPREPEAYIHRIGRTARAGAEGVAISLCGSEDRSCLRNIERMLKRSVPVCMDHAYHCEYAAKAHAKSTSAPSRFKHSSRRSGGGKRAPWHKRRSSSGGGHRTSTAVN